MIAYPEYTRVITKKMIVCVDCKANSIKIRNLCNQICPNVKLRLWVRSFIYAIINSICTLSIALHQVILIEWFVLTKASLWEQAIVVRCHLEHVFLLLWRFFLLIVECFILFPWLCSGKLTPSQFGLVPVNSR